MVDYNKAGQSSEGNVSNHVLSMVSGGRKKMWIIVGGSILVIVLLIFGGFLVTRSLDKDDILSDEGAASFQTNFPRTIPTDDTIPIDSRDVVSLQDLLDEESNQVEDGGLGPELGMTITRLACSNTSFDIEVTVGALPIEGVIFYFKDGTLNLPYSELRFISSAGIETFSFDVSGQGFDILNSVVEVKAFTLDGESEILDSKSC